VKWYFGIVESWYCGIVVLWYCGSCLRLRLRLRLWCVCGACGALVVVGEGSLLWSKYKQR